jgi:hypothetical protein
MSADHSERSWIDFEWAAIRVVPRVHTGEFLNVGVILHARTRELLALRIEPDWERLELLSAGLDRAAVKRHLRSYRRVAEGQDDAGPVALLPPSERFHWLTSPRSSVVQTSEVHPGRSHDPLRELDHLFDEQCGLRRPPRSDTD